MPTATPTRIAVVGPGAIGATVAAVAVQAGHEVVLCGRTPLDRIVVEPDGAEPVTVPGPVRTDPETEPPSGLQAAFVAVKAHQVEAAAPWLEALDAPVVVALQNGVEQREWLTPHVADGTTVLPSVVWFPAETLEPGRVRLRERARLTLPDEPAAHDVAAILEQGPCDVALEPDFTTATWRKLVVNAVAALLVLSGRRARIFAREDVRGLGHALALEAVAVARAEGAALPDATADEVVAQFEGMPPDLGTSMLFDREAGRRLEWDARNGVVARLGRRHSIPTPVSDVLIPLLAAASDG